ncbi:YpoC family protein [Alkalihalobacillus sp. CinArs1]|uniref:YpoC family protein n=1 Tax=Alkalihalobacillus sp. CinArs1 TaxID=2995314 RepID=UPI0022DD590E|nr:hypothetical protein [Alkalihalobacillus sp. CinArs1]
MESKGLPKAIHHPLFFADSDWHEEIKHTTKRNPFFYEVQEFLGQKDERPWDSPTSHLKEYFEQWKDVEETIRAFFSSRKKKEASIEMVFQIGYLMEALFWLNGRRALAGEWQATIRSLEISPINGAERLNYVIDHYDHYTSFVQLRELIHDLHKKWMKNEAIKKSQSD